ncbi:uL30 family ribosomal protein [Candidatus Micrarchaeota archaeon]|nr:uL30 family ribosomal protein [Candidatus Micrarchaeota archaeon]
MKYAVIRVRGVRKIAPRINKSLELLRLERPNHCVLVEDSPQNKGMLEKAKDYVTYGPVAEETIAMLLQKRGRKGASLLRSVLKEEEVKKAATEIFSGKKTSEFANPVFRLSPPSRGYRDTKRSFPQGDLGKRGEMDSLLRRMI